MSQIYVSLDLETTGLNPETDQIIEIGAVKFQGKENLDTFHTLVNPYQPLPLYICLLTSITQEEVKTAPPLAAVAGGLVSFVGDHPIVGQNIPFDLNFLSSKGIRFSNPTCDTRELANIFLPRLSDYSLSGLARELGVPCPVHHRALADAITAKEVFLGLIDKISQLDASLIVEINRLTAATDWSFRKLLLDLKLKEVLAEAVPQAR